LAVISLEHGASLAETAVLCLGRICAGADGYGGAQKDGYEISLKTDARVSNP
jgi:hypothetical protein